MSETATTTKPKAPPPPAVITPITKVKTLQELFNHPGLRSRMEKILPQHMSPDRLLRTLMNAGLKTPGLMKVDPMSMLGAAMTLAYLGLEPNTPLQLVHLIPFDVTKWNPATRKRDYIRTDATIIIGYQGYIDLVDRAGRVKDIDCQLIWPGDVWEEERGTNKHFRHLPKHLPHAADVEPDFAYMHARLVNGGEHIELMTRADIHRIRARSQGYQTAMRALEDAQKHSRKPSGAYTEAPWIKWPDGMWRKTPLRTGQKYLPKSAQLAVAIDVDEAGEEGRVRFSQVLDAEAVSEGAWAISPEEVDPDEELEVTDTKEKPEPTRTTTSGKAAPAKTEPPKTEPPKTTTKTATPAPDEPPAGRWGDEPTSSGPTEGATGQEADAGSEAADTDAEASDAQAGEAAATDFDEWLLDVNGEPIGEETHTTPLAFAQALEQAWRNPVGREALIEQNRDGMAKAAAADPKAKAIIDSLSESPETEQAQAIDHAVAIPTASGRENLPQYLKDFRAASQALTAENYMDFLAANAATMTKVAASTRSLLVKAMAEAADRLNIERPAALATILAGPVKDDAAELERDNRAADARIAELKDCKDQHAMTQWREGAVLRAFTSRLDREGKRAILDRLNAAWEDQKKAISR